MAAKDIKLVIKDTVNVPNAVESDFKKYCDVSMTETGLLILLKYVFVTEEQTPI